MHGKELKITETDAWLVKFGFECYGAKIGIRADDASLLPKIREILPSVSRECRFDEAENVVSLIVSGGERANGLYFNREPALEFDEFDDALLEFIEDKILMVLAAVSLPAKLYLHAGAVVWKGAGILIPGNTFSGKTTLVRSLIQAGAIYYSDDCIVLDDRNRMLPFPRELAIRTPGGRIFRDAAHFGAANGVEPCRIDLILFSIFEENAVWQPSPLSPGESVLELLNNFYFKPSIGDAPREIFKILTNLAARAEVFRGKRGETEQIIEWLAEKYDNGKRNI